MYEENIIGKEEKNIESTSSQQELVSGEIWKAHQDTILVSEGIEKTAQEVKEILDNSPKLISYYNNERGGLTSIITGNKYKIASRRNKEIIKIYDTQVKGATNSYIAKSILEISRILGSSIEQLTSEIERKNKLDEYYMLMKEIENYDDELMRLEYYEQAYEEMQIVQVPIINLEVHQVWLISILREQNRECYDDIMRISKYFSKNPYYVLIEKIEEYGLYYDSYYCSGNIYFLEDVYVNTKDLFNYIHTRGIISASYQLREEHIIKSEEYRLSSIQCINIAKKEDEYKKYANRICLENEDLYSFFDTIVENTFRMQKNNFFITKEYVEIRTEIDSLNREISLANLRNLHSGLRNEIRKCKIERYNKKN